jgi:uncharacterized protein with FMN-binding domain
MRRAILALGSTIAGIAVLLSFKTHSTATVGAAAMAAPNSPTRTPGGARTVTGSVAETARGPMQVELTLDGQRITRVTMLQRTNDGPLSDQIDSTAIPKLINETLSAQSAQIDAVSGASYTSQGYLQSLQSALDKITGRAR